MGSGPQFYVGGGTLSVKAPCYLTRRADRDLQESLLDGQFCYVLTARQMGKSSLMVRTAYRLQQTGANVVALDLTALGSNLTPEQWYQGIALQIGQRTHLEDELDDFWEANQRVGPCHRLFLAISEVVQPLLRQRVAEALPPDEQLSGLAAPLSVWQSVVFFVDEIDMVRSLPFSTDEFFAAIRECYNLRAWEDGRGCLTFCLLGVATPSQLTQDPSISPFNIGRRIELEDFTRQQMSPLASGFREGIQADRMLDQIYAWTHGHPYLTQKLCGAAAEATATAAGGGGNDLVNRLCGELFLRPRSHAQDDNLHFVQDRVLRARADKSAILSLYGDIWRGKRVAADTKDALVSDLLLSGLVCTERGNLRVRNRIYKHAFNLSWVNEESPGSATRAQRQAYWKGISRSAGVALLVIIALLAFALQQARLAESEASRSAQLAQLDSFFELSEDLFVLASAEGTFLKLNRKWEELLGYSREELCEVPYNHFVHPEDRDGTAIRTKHLANGMSVLNFTNRYRCSKGTYVTLVWRARTDPNTGIICATARTIEDAISDPPD